MAGKTLPSSSVQRTMGGQFSAAHSLPVTTVLNSAVGCSGVPYTANVKVCKANVEAVLHPRVSPGDGGGVGYRLQFSTPLANTIFVKTKQPSGDQYMSLPHVTLLHPANHELSSCTAH